jgi:hypothetical protein
MTAPDGETIPATAPRSAELLRRIAQVALAVSPDVVPEIRVGDTQMLDRLREHFGGSLPATLEAMYAEADPGALTIPLPGEDLDFIPLSDAVDAHIEDGLPPNFAPFARASKAVIAVDVQAAKGGPDAEHVEQAPVVVLQRTGGEWDSEVVAESLDRFLSVLLEVLEWMYRSMRAQSAGEGERSPADISVTVDPEKLVELESLLEEVDRDHVDFWMSLVS